MAIIWKKEQILWQKKRYASKTGEMLNWEELDEDTKELQNEYYQDMKTELDLSNSVTIHNLLK